MPLSPQDTAALRKYTGWYASSDGGGRVVLTIDGGLSISYVDPITGALGKKRGIALALGIGQDPDAEELKLPSDEKLNSGAQGIIFKIENNVVNGLTASGKLYERTPPSPCGFFKLPTEIRRMVWNHVLLAPGRKVVQTRASIDDDKRIISINQEKPWNRIHEVCKLLKADARHMELVVNDLHVPIYDTEANFLLNLLHITQPILKNTLRKVVLERLWGPSHEPPKEILHGLLDFARENDRVQIHIKMKDWYLFDQRPIQAPSRLDFRLFVRFGLVLRESFRTKRHPVCFFESINVWREGRKSAHVSVPNMKFFPRHEEEWDDKYEKTLRLACRVKPFQVYMTLLSQDKTVAEKMLVEAVDKWYKEGV